MEGLAQHLCSAIKISSPSINVVYFDGDYSYNIVLPYVAGDIYAVLLASFTEISCTYRVIQALALLGIDTIAILPTVTVAKLGERLELYNQNIYVMNIDNDIYRLAVLHSSLKLALTLSRGEISRIKKFERELDMKSVVKELVDRYFNIVNQTKSRKQGMPIVAVSKSLLAAGEELMDRGIPVQVIGRKGLEHQQPDIVVYTSVEEHTVNEYLSLLARRGIRRDDIATIRINTDPFTAPLYTLIIFYSTLL